MLSGPFNVFDLCLGYLFSDLNEIIAFGNRPLFSDFTYKAYSKDCCVFVFLLNQDKQGIPWWLGVSYKGIGQYDLQDKLKPRKVELFPVVFIYPNYQ